MSTQLKLIALNWKGKRNESTWYVVCGEAKWYFNLIVRPESKPTKVYNSNIRKHTSYKDRRVKKMQAKMVINVN